MYFRIVALANTTNWQILTHEAAPLWRQILPQLRYKYEPKYLHMAKISVDMNTSSADSLLLDTVMCRTHIIFFVQSYIILFTKKSTWK